MLLDHQKSLRPDYLDLSGQRRQHSLFAAAMARHTVIPVGGWERMRLFVVGAKYDPRGRCRRNEMSALAFGYASAELGVADTRKKNPGRRRSGDGGGFLPKPMKWVRFGLTVRVIDGLNAHPSAREHSLPRPVRFARYGCSVQRDQSTSGLIRSEILVPLLRSRCVPAADTPLHWPCNGTWSAWRISQASLSKAQRHITPNGAQLPC
jgi:hypothetical protein